MKIRKLGLAAAAAMALAHTPLAAQELTIADVNRSQANCDFDPACKGVSTDTSVNLQYYMQGDAAQIKTSTLAGLAGSPAAGKTGYEYQIDLTAVPVNGGSECIFGMVLGFRTVDQVNYGGNGAADLYVVTSGGSGTIAPTAAELIAPGLVEIDFGGAGICAGQASMTFGLSSSQGSPAPADIRLLEPGPVPILDVTARVPSGAIGMQLPAAPTNLHVTPQ
jgi:hypothetical protein